MKKLNLTFRRTGAILVLILLISGRYAKAENLSETYRNMRLDYGKKYEAKYDRNSDGVINIYDLVLLENEMQSIDVSKIKSNYLQIISPQDKADFEESNIKILNDKAFVVTEKGIDLFAYVDAAEGLEIQIVEGDDNFRVENGYLYLNPEKASSIAKVRLKNAYAVSEEFYIYGTSDRELHDFTYDYFLNLIQ